MSGYPKYPLLETPDVAGYLDARGLLPLLGVTSTASSSPRSPVAARTVATSSGVTKVPLLPKPFRT